MATNPPAQIPVATKLTLREEVNVQQSARSKQQQQSCMLMQTVQLGADGCAVAQPETCLQVRRQIVSL